MTEANSTRGFSAAKSAQFVLISDGKRDAFRHIQLQHSALGILIYDVYWYGIHIYIILYLPVNPHKVSQVSGSSPSSPSSHTGN